MKKLLSVLMTLCQLCTAVAALAEAEAPTFDEMPHVVTVDEGVELTFADFEGQWIVDKIFFEETYLTPEEAEELGLSFWPFSIAEGKIIRIFTDEEGEHEASAEVTLESNQLLFTDAEGIEAVIEKLEDGNIVLSVFIPVEGEVVACISYFMVHPEA